MKKIFLVDDHPMLREGLIRLIARMPECEVCGEAGDAAAASEAITRLLPDLVILDISLPDKSGLELIKDLLCLMPDLKVLVFSMHDEMIYAERVVRAGARGYIMKGTTTDNLLKAIESVLAGDHYLSECVSNHLFCRLSGGKRSADSRPGAQGRLSGIGTLTDRELEVYELIGRGKSVGQIAEQLRISPRTVDAHRGNIKSKLGLHDAAALMRSAVLWVELASKPLAGAQEQRGEIAAS